MLRGARAPFGRSSESEEESNETNLRNGGAGGVLRVDGGGARCGLCAETNKRRSRRRETADERRVGYRPQDRHRDAYGRRRNVEREERSLSRRPNYGKHSNPGRRH